MSKHPPAEFGLFAPAILKPAISQSFLKLNPKSLARNPVMFTTALVSLFATILTVREFAIGGPTAWIGPADHDLALVHRPVREFRRSGGGRSRQGACGRLQGDKVNGQGAVAAQPARP